jgi:phospholipase C
MRIGNIAALLCAAGCCQTGSAQLRGEAVTPIRHVVVIFQENVSFDHYFATYPEAANLPGEPEFHARPDVPTPGVNGLSGSLLSANPNAAGPVRLTRAQAVTCSQSHNYTREQQAFDHGLMDKFLEFTSVSTASCAQGLSRQLVMGYYDGNTVTALWNYAQHFAMSDNYFASTFGPSTPGAVNLISGQTHGAAVMHDVGTAANQVVQGSMVDDVRSALDDCVPSTQNMVVMTGRNVGDLLNDARLTWGWFQGGFKPSSRTADGTAVCATRHAIVSGALVTDYVPHHQPFQYYPSTANQHHLPPTSVDMIGRGDRANHQYDLEDFWAAANAGNLPAVSFLKAAAYQDGHPSNSDPLDEQNFLVQTINALQQLPQWSDMAIIITYDDSDGWYDHVMPPIVSRSSSAADALTGPGSCGTPAPGEYGGRCGYGPRLPLLIVSPWSRQNYVDHTLTNQASVLKFIEDNWSLGRIGDQSFDEGSGTLMNLFDFRSRRAGRRLLLHPHTGLPASEQ